MLFKNTVAADFMGLKKNFNPKIENMKVVPTRLHKSKSISNYTMVKLTTSSVKRNLKNNYHRKRKIIYKGITG